MEASTPLQGNAFIKAKVDAEAAGKSSFTVDGKEHPVQMHGKVQDKIDKARKKFVRKGEEGDFYEMHQDLYRDESMSREMNEPSPNQKKNVASVPTSSMHMNSPLNAYVDGSENKAQDLTGVMKDYFSSVKSTTVAAINAGKKKKTKQTEADKKVYDDFMLKQDNEFANQLKKNEEFRNLSSEERIEKVLRTPKTKLNTVIPTTTKLG